ncbi:MAG TPA: hypothetical protein VLB86_09190 [Gaiellaceae bacterium]|nr:hypothetical protein [Gaiellaceae bacterium]
MDTWVWIVIAVAVIVVLAAVAWYVVNERRRRELQEGFGPEYDRTVAEAPSRREAESELRERVARHEEFDIRPLSTEARDRYARSWESAQARFVDDPEAAIGEADELIQAVMRERGYPVDDFDQRSADLSVDYPHVVEHYREGHAIARRTIRGEGDTESLRQAMVHYRALFSELLETGDTATTRDDHVETTT